jgi:hypothetical protein
MLSTSFAQSNSLSFSVVKFRVLIRNVRFNGGSELAWKDLRTILTTEGERMVMSAVHECMSALAEPAMLKQMESTTLDSSLFATAILGFDELNRSSLAFEDSLAM